MKKFLTGVLALTICGLINFGLTDTAQAADLSSTIGLNDAQLQELYGPPPPNRDYGPPPPPPPGRHRDYGPPPPHHRHGPPPFHRRRHAPPPPPPPEPYRNQRPRW